ncbi:MAG: hypothetical protein ACFBZ8_10420 [Opitutales bacterium]
MSKAPLPRRLAFLCSLVAIAPAASAQTIVVNVDQRIATVEDTPVGLNVSYLMDDDTRISRDTSTDAALAEMRVGYLRYPGGEKADNYLWSTAPWTQPAPIAARPHAWPTTNNDFFQSDRTTARAETMDFDEFMALCQSVGAEPVICVAFDSMYKSASGSETPPTKAQLLNNAVEWVRYANITRGYNIRYWTLGNETDYGTSYAGANPGANSFGDDAAEFAQAMKAVDPTILIGVNGHSRNWFNKVLSRAGPHVDFLEVHTYPFWNRNDYDHYRTRNETNAVLNEVNNIAIAAINDQSNPADRERLFVTLTETGALYFGDGPGWENINNLGKALATFEILARHLEIDKVAFTLLWNTRWVDNDEGRIVGEAPPPAGLEALTDAQDPGIELGGVWQIGGSLEITSDAHTGSQALLNTGAYHDIEVPVSLFEPGTSYRFSYWGKRLDSSKWGVAGVTFFNGSAKVRDVKINTGSGGYSQYSQNFTTPAEFDSVFLWNMSQGGGQLLIDDYSIVTNGSSGGDPPSAYDALDRAGNLNATGQVMKILGRFLKDHMVAVSGENVPVQAYATTSEAGALSVFLLHKNYQSRNITLQVDGHSGTQQAVVWNFTGENVDDTEPTFERTGIAELTNGTASLSLPGTSITVLDFAPIPQPSLGPSPSQANHLQLEWMASESWYYWLKHTTNLEATRPWPDANNFTPGQSGADGVMTFDFDTEVEPLGFFEIHYSPEAE